MVTTSLTRTLTSSGLGCGASTTAGAGTGTTETLPVADDVPLDMVQRNRKGSLVPAMSVIRRTLWSITLTDAVAFSGTATDCRTGTPPDGSESLASGSSSTLPPTGRSATSWTATGFPVSLPDSTSTRM